MGEHGLFCLFYFEYKTNMSAKPKDDGAAAEKPKSKKMLIIIVVALVLVLGGAGAFFMLKGGHGDGEEGDEHAAEQTSKKGAKPEYMPLENVVVNLADQENSRFAQVGITLQLLDGATVEAVKTVMPTVRNGVLLLISKHTAEELMNSEGKEQLAQEILDLVREQAHFPLKEGRKNPVQAVLFSSFIVQ